MPWVQRSLCAMYKVAPKYCDVCRSIDRHEFSRIYTTTCRGASSRPSTSVSRKVSLDNAVRRHGREVTSLCDTCANSMTCPHRHHVIICAVLLSGVAALPPLIKIGKFTITVTLLHVFLSSFSVADQRR